MPMWMPMLPHVPRFPHHPAHAGLGSGSPGGMPGANDPFAGYSLQARLAAHGVPLSFTDGGLPVLRGGAGDMSVGMPPEIPGMPKMPAPPPGFLGGLESAGLGHFPPSAPPPPPPFGAAFAPPGSQ